ncbi:MAG: 50S ribosomal protein L18 [Candidatus Marinimicrobia bacterium]|nr:50S ribosomal protein L18 [Candidatus Neomarinimicrobiota bacterium]MCF7841038.1 50S ribosomal protein L18 [Candidatus Neomarinimicrobiota bacterium]MCF7903130.1 50S ribosomal protein L18 [Candidatus Neomarinimicrobiota bacterium]
MSGKKSIREQKRLRRKKAIRQIISGSAERPRLVVFRSNRHIFAQLVDDGAGKVLTGVSSLNADVVKSVKKDMTKSDVSKLVGTALGEKAVAEGIKEVVFDRNGFVYHGRVQALADAAREAGLEF